MSPSLTLSDPLSPGESQTNHTAKSASCTRHWSNISFRSSVLHSASVCVNLCECVQRCREKGDDEWKRKWEKGEMCVLYSSANGSGLLSWSHKTLSATNFPVFVLSLAGFKLWDHRTNSTPLAVATDDKVDADGLWANTRNVEMPLQHEPVLN